MATTNNWHTSGVDRYIILAMRPFAYANDILGKEQEKLGQDRSPYGYRCIYGCSICEFYNRLQHYSQFATALAQSRVLRNQGRGEYIAATPQPIKHMAKAYYDPKYFFEDGECKAHNDYDCERCEQKAGSTKALTTLVVAGEAQAGIDATKAKENFDKQVEFIQIALDKSDKAMENMKVQDLPQMVRKAQEEITVGKMKKLLDKEVKPMRGVVNKTIRWVTHQLKKKR